MEPTKFHKIGDLMERLNSDADDDKCKLQTESVNGISKLKPGEINNQAKVSDENHPSIKSIKSQQNKSK